MFVKEKFRHAIVEFRKKKLFIKYCIVNLGKLCK